MATSEPSAPISPIKPVLPTYLSTRPMRSHRPVREAAVTLALVPWPWRVTRVRLSEAARLAGVSGVSLQSALEKHRLSCDTDEKGQRWIAVSEIARVYPDTFRSVPRNAPRRTMEQLIETALERELRQRLSDKDTVIADLRRRLDAEAEERRQLLAILEAIQRMLEDRMQPATASHHAEGERRAPWWRRWWR